MATAAATSDEPAPAPTTVLGLVAGTSPAMRALSATATGPAASGARMRLGNTRARGTERTPTTVDTHTGPRSRTRCGRSYHSDGDQQELDADDHVVAPGRNLPLRRWSALPRGPPRDHGPDPGYEHCQCAADEKRRVVTRATYTLGDSFVRFATGSPATDPAADCSKSLRSRSRNSLCGPRHLPKRFPLQKTTQCVLEPFEHSCARGAFGPVSVPLTKGVDELLVSCDRIAHLLIA